MSKLKVLSLFDGMSCGQIALKELGLETGHYEYYASEIDANAVKITKANFPNTIHIGDVTNVSYSDGILTTEAGSYNVGEINLLIGGSPCTNLSFIGNQKGMVTEQGVDITNLEQYLELKEQGFQFSGQSYLFWEYVRLKKETEADVFLLENVKMSNKWRNVFDQIMEVSAIEINSNLVSAQNRQRFYWSNLAPSLPEDRNITTKDVYNLNMPMRDVIPSFQGLWGGGKENR